MPTETPPSATIPIAMRPCATIPIVTPRTVRFAKIGLLPAVWQGSNYVTSPEPSRSSPTVRFTRRVLGTQARILVKYGSSGSS